MRLQTPNAIEITHSAEDIKKHFQASLDALQADKVDMFYLRGLSGPRCASVSS